MPFVPDDWITAQEALLLLAPHYSNPETCEFELRQFVYNGDVRFRADHLLWFERLGPNQKRRRLNYRAGLTTNSWDEWAIGECNWKLGIINVVGGFQEKIFQLQGAQFFREDIFSIHPPRSPRAGMGGPRRKTTAREQLLLHLVAMSERGDLRREKIESLTLELKEKFDLGETIIRELVGDARRELFNKNGQGLSYPPPST